MKLVVAAGFALATAIAGAACGGTPAIPVAPAAPAGVDATITDAGTLCVVVFDAQFQTVPGNYTVTVSHS